MMKLFTLAYLFAFNYAYTQDLSELVDSVQEKERNITTATFKSTRLINGQTIENPGKGVLQFFISHRFGPVNSGIYNFYGMDQAVIRLGLDYGITDRLCLGIGRSSIGKVFDGLLKAKIIKQQTGLRRIPFSMVYYTDVAMATIEKSTEEMPINLTQRLSYVHQILIARKFGNFLSIQLMPTFIHRNLVDKIEDENDVFSLGGGGQIKVTKRFSLTSEYYYLMPGKTADNFKNSFAVGFDLETGGHVFQIHVTNGLGMIESQFIPQTIYAISRGDLQIGFNISRVFTIVRRK